MHFHCCDEVDPATVCPDPSAHIDKERFAWDVWEMVTDTLQPQFVKAGEGVKWGRSLRAFIVRRLSDPAA